MFDCEFSISIRDEKKAHTVDKLFRGLDEMLYNSRLGRHLGLIKRLKSNAAVGHFVVSFLKLFNDFVGRLNAEIETVRAS